MLEQVFISAADALVIFVLFSLAISRFMTQEFKTCLSPTASESEFLSPPRVKSDMNSF
jgi:hypothetical protein